MDSMQVYRGMDIGTAKASPAMQARVPHHMVDIRDPEDDLAVAEFQAEGRAVLEQLAAAGVTPVICGGSGLHFRSLVDPLHFPPSDEKVRAEVEAMDPGEARDRLLQLDPAAGEHVDLANPRRVVRALEIALVTGLLPSVRARSADAAAVRDYRPRMEFVAIGLDADAELADRVESRFDAMLASGLLEEVATLQPRLGKLAAQAVGYKELLPVVAGETSLAAGRLAAVQATRALARRQRTFFRRDPRISWVPWHPDAAVRISTALDRLDEQVSWTS